MGSKTIEVDGAELEVQYLNGEASVEVKEHSFTDRVLKKAEETFMPSAVKGVYSTKNKGCSRHSYALVIEVSTKTEPEKVSEFFQEFNVEYFDFQNERDEETYGFPEIENEYKDHLLIFLNEN